MKKFIALVAALVSFGAIADNHDHNHKHMVTLSGWEDARSADLTRSLDFAWSTGGENSSAHDTTKNIALNYAYAINGSWQLGAEYAMWDQEGSAKEMTEANRWGVFAIYNFAGRLHDTNYLGVKYSMMESEMEDDAGLKTMDMETNAWTFEFGHRFSLGHMWSMDFNWSPSLSVSVADMESDIGSKDDWSRTSAELNVLKVDVLF